ncbi:MAG: hypothetical protein K8R58_02325, partial [Bacteroidales bacterium]|nr:hypothetical protein [Bacteroidales bacterium]
MKNTKLIQKYINGNLDEEKLQLFQDELQSNPDFAKELNLREKINDAILEKKMTIHQKHADKIKNIELIEKYIDGELDDEKTNLFQNMLKNNPALA